MKKLPTNNRAYITGASSGIGLAIKVEGEKRGFNVKDFSFETGYDLRKTEDIEKLVKLVKVENPSILFLNAGIASFKKFDEEDYGSISSMFDVNVIANMSIISALKSEIKNGLNIVVTLSTAAYINGVDEAVYNSTKKALKEYIISVNTELEISNIENRIFMFVPHKIDGTLMTSKINKPSEKLRYMIMKLFDSIENGKYQYIPLYDEIYKNVFKRYVEDPIGQGVESVEYRRKNNEK